MHLSHIRRFLAVVEAGSLRAAAGSLAVSQPAITKSIRQLEEELHVRLLLRNARGASLTSAGRNFLPRAKVILAELRKAEDDLAGFRGGVEGAVAFGVAPQTCVLLVPEALQQFRRRYATARVRIVEGVSTGLLPQVRDETLDFCVSMGPSQKLDGAIRFKPLFRPSLVVAGRKGTSSRSGCARRSLRRW